MALKPGPHEGYVDRERAEAIRTMARQNVPTSSRGAPEFGAAPLRGLPRCRRRGGKPGVRQTRAAGEIPCYVRVRGRIDCGEPNRIASGGLRADDVVEVVRTPDGKPSASAS